MPTTINGIGTQYYGRQSVRNYVGTCDSCGFHGQLSDYETGHFFVVVFIPLIPLGKKQIIGDCPSCRRHRAMPLSQWHQIREESIEKGLSELAAAPDDPNKALDLLGTLTLFNRRDEAIDLAASTHQSHLDKVDVQIGLGAWYEQQGLATDAEKCYQRAIALEPDYPPCRRIRAFDCMEAGKPGEAAQHLQPLRHPSEYYDPGLFLVLANAFQAQGQHDAALAEYADVLQHVPDLVKDKAVRKAVQRSEKALGRTETILPKKGLFG